MNERLLRDVEILTDLMEKDGWTTVRVASEDFSLNLSHYQQDRGGAGRQVSVSELPRGSPQTRAKTQAPAPATSDREIDQSWVAVDAPNLGTFYRSPKPGAPPFVEVGQRVEQGAELCLIEVMKLFTSVRANITGTVRHIAATDAQLVEGGQPLMYIQSE